MKYNLIQLIINVKWEDYKIRLLIMDKQERRPLSHQGLCDIFHDISN